MTSILLVMMISRFKIEMSQQKRLEFVNDIGSMIDGMARQTIWKGLFVKPEFTKARRKRKMSKISRLVDRNFIEKIIKQGMTKLLDGILDISA